MNALMGMTVGELVEHMRVREQRLPFEIGSFVALEVCESVIEGPAVVTTETIRISDEGVVSVYAPPHSAGNADAAQSVAQVLARLLVAAGSGVPPILLQLVEQGPSDGRWDLGRLRDEIEASLVPLNRSAARRVLSRLVRDLKRPVRKSSRPPPRRAAPAAPAPTGDLDADLDALLGGDDIDEELPTQQLPQLDARGNPLVDFSDIASKRSPGSPSARRIAEPVVPQARAPIAARPTERQRPARRPEEKDDRVTPMLQVQEPKPLPSDALPSDEGLPTATTGRLSGLDDDYADDFSQTGKTRWGLYVMLLMVAAALAFGAIFVFRPDVIDRLTGDYIEPDLEAELAAAQAEEDRRGLEAHAEALSHFGDLTVHTNSDRAQILLFIGRGPAVAENLPIGVAHEFVAIADGKTPTRAVLPASGEWTQVDETTQQYELAMQTGDRDMSFEDLDLGASRLERDEMGSATGALGRGRIITTPQGARVFLLIGFGNAHVSDLPTGEPQELIVFEEGFVPQRVFVGPSDWRDAGERKSAEVEVTLVER